MLRPGAPASPVPDPRRTHGLRADLPALHLLVAPVYALWGWLLWEDAAFAAGLMLVMWLFVGALLRHWQRRGRSGANMRIVAAWALTSALPGSALLLLPWRKTRRLLVPPPSPGRSELGHAPAAETSRGAVAFEIVVGIVAIAAGLFWMLVWLLVALLTWGDFLGDSGTRADLEVLFWLSLGLLPIAFGIAMLLGPRRRGALWRRFRRGGDTAGRPRLPEGGSEPTVAPPPPPQARRSQLRTILGYVGGTVGALIGALVLLSIVVGAFSSSSGGGPGDPSSAGVIDSEPFWSPDSRLIAFDRSDYGSPDDESSGPSDVFVASADGHRLRRLTQTPENETVLGWLANPPRIVYSTYRPKEPTSLHALGLQGRARVKLGELPKTDQLLALSHDARQALVGTPRLYPKRYGLVDLVRKTRRSLPGRGGDWMLMDGAWSQDDSMLAYVTRENIVILRGGRVLRRVPLPRYDAASGGLAWSPDGRRLAYGDGGENSALWLVRINDGSRSWLTEGTDTSDLNPVWSPDGSKIYYEHRSDGDHDGLRMMSPNGTGDRKITTDDWAGGGLLNFEGKNDRWLDTATISPDGTKIAYLLGQRGGWKNWSLVGVMNADGSDKTPFPGSA